MSFSLRPHQELDKNSHLPKVSNVDDALLNLFLKFSSHLLELLNNKKISEDIYAFYLDHTQQFLKSISRQAETIHYANLYKKFISDLEAKLLAEGHHDITHILEKKPRVETEVEKYLQLYLTYCTELLMTWSIISFENKAIDIAEQNAEQGIHLLTQETKTTCEASHHQLFNVQYDIEHHGIMRRNPYLTSDFYQAKETLERLLGTYKHLIPFQLKQIIKHLRDEFAKEFYATCIEHLKEKNQLISLVADVAIQHHDSLTRKKLTELKDQQTAYLQTIDQRRQFYLSTIDRYHNDIETLIAESPTLREAITSSFPSVLQRLNELIKEIDQYGKKLTTITTESPEYKTLSAKISDFDARIDSLIDELNEYKAGMAKQQTLLIGGPRQAVEKLSDVDYLKPDSDLQIMGKSIVSDLENIRKRTSSPIPRLQMSALELGHTIIDAKDKIVDTHEQLIEARKKFPFQLEDPLENLNSIRHVIAQCKENKASLANLPKELLHSAYHQANQLRLHIQQLQKSLNQILVVIDKDKNHEYAHMIAKGFASCFDMQISKPGNKKSQAVHVPLNTFLHDELNAFDERIQLIRNIQKRDLVPIKLAFHIFQSYVELIENNPQLKSQYMQLSAQFNACKLQLVECLEGIDDCTLHDLDARVTKGKQIQAEIVQLNKHIQALNHSISKEKNAIKNREIKAAQLAAKQKQKDEYAAYLRMKKLPLADLAHLSQHEKIIFLTYESQVYLKHLHHSILNEVGRTKLEIMNHVDKILMSNKTDDAKLEETSIYFDTKKAFLTQNSDGALLHFLKVVAAILAPSLRKRLEKVKGQLLVDSFTPVLLPAEANSQQVNSMRASSPEAPRK